MQLLEVKISGFKSFVDAVTVPIQEGLTGIVGPNGCGKSNVLEAIRWAMGATSAKALRGAEMDDIIFGGTDNRPQRDIAEVVLKLDNNDKTAPEPFRNEQLLEISRKIRRGHGSTYRINGKEVRAKDVQLLFADASSGANSPALVRQGQVSELINAKPENRRRVLEEASGIAGLQARRHEAIIKLNGTESNLERVNEIILTLGENITSLKRQAVKAEKYRAIGGIIRGLEAYIADDKYKSILQTIKDGAGEINNINLKIADLISETGKTSRQLEEIEKNLPQAREEMAIADEVLKRLELKRFEFDRDLKDIDDKSKNAKNNLERIINDISREKEITAEGMAILENAQQNLKELESQPSEHDVTIELNANVQSLKTQIEEIQNQQQEIIGQKAKVENSLNNDIQSLARLKNDEVRLKSNLERLEREFAHLQKQKIEQSLIDNGKQKLQNTLNAIQNAEAEYNDLVKTQQNLEAKEQDLRNNHNDLQSRINSLNTQIKALGTIVAQGNKSGKNPIINNVNVAPGYEKALSAAIGDDLDADIKTGDKYFSGAIIQEIKWPIELQNLPKLSDFVTAPDELSARIATIKIVPVELLSIAITLPIGCRIVTKDGELRRWDGLIKTRNAPNPAAIRFEQQNQIKQLQAELEPLEPQLPIITKELAEVRAALSSARARANNERARHPKLMLDVQNAQKELNDLINRQTLNDEKINLAANNLNDAQTAHQKILTEIADANDKVENLRNDIKRQIIDFDSNLFEINQNLNNTRQEMANILSRISSLRSAQEERKKQIQSANSQIQSWQSRIDKSNERINALLHEQTTQEEIINDLRNKPQQLEGLLQETMDKFPLAEKRKISASDTLSNIESETRNYQTTIRQLENALSSQKESLSALMATQNGRKERQEEIKNEILDNFNCDPQELYENSKNLLATNLSLSLFNSLDKENASTRLARALKERENLGGVNLSADEELKTQSERVTNLETERDELLSAVAKLRRAIDEINAEGREKLIRAFDVVNTHFTQLFTTLFEGGQAYLSLTETDDPLGGGLEVFACPPGKRLQSMTLMSGGEQALTATALIFAVFLSNPAPLSVLDEIDAPLDDANVERFCKLINEMRKRTKTKFIVVTHHPITMARMDRLFGVTMMEKGVSQLVSVDLSRAESMINNTDSAN